MVDVVETPRRARGFGTHRSGSGARLIEAVHVLAAEQPIHDISVAALCQKAGTTRDTFYRYGSRPIDILAMAIDEDLPSAAKLLMALISHSWTANPLRVPGRTVLQHIERNWAVYQHALHPHLDSALREVLVSRFEALLTGYLQTRPEAVPSIGGSPASAPEIRRLAVFTAAGIVGAIEDWINQDQPDPLDRMLALLFTAATPWWQRGGNSEPPR